MKILIIRLSSFGDILLTFPLINFIKVKYPDAEVDYIIKKEFSGIFDIYPDKINLIKFDKDNGLKGLRILRNRIKNNNYDIILDLHNNFRSIYLRLFQKAEKSVIKKYSFRKKILVHLKMNLLKHILSIRQRYLLTLEKITGSSQKEILKYAEYYINLLENDKSAPQIPPLGAENTFVGFCPSAKHFTKIWPKEKFVELGKALIEKYNITILIFGGPFDTLHNEIIEKGIGNNAINFSGKYSLFQTAVLMNRCKLIVTNDSGLMHLANLLGKNLISIFGSTVKEFGFYPYGNNVTIIENKNLCCRPCTHIGRKDCPKKHFRCMNQIDSQDILKAAEIYLIK